MSSDMLSAIYFGSRTLHLQAPFLCGRDVKILQSLLDLLPNLSASLEFDGIFGPETRIAIKKFQKYFKLKADGVVRCETFYALGQRTGRYCKNQEAFSSRALITGIQGGDVQVLQNRLASYRKALVNRPASGKFSSMTLDAVRAFQQDFSLQNTGSVTPDTFEYLFIHAPMGGRVLQKGRHGLDTYWLQFCLHDFDYFGKFPHGFFDRYTEKAVKKFQSDAGIRVDGIVGPQTFLAIGNSLPFPRRDYYYPARKGESLQDIACLLGTEPEALAQLNSLKPPGYKIKSRRFLDIPLPRAYHLSEKGDTLATIAARYGMDEAALIQANTLSPSSCLLQGDTVFLPGYRMSLKGYIIYTDHTGGKIILKSLNLETMKVEILHVFQRDLHKELKIDREKNLVCVFDKHSRQTAAYSLAERASGAPVLTCLPEEKEKWLYSMTSLTAYLNCSHRLDQKMQSILSRLSADLPVDTTLSIRTAPDGYRLLFFSPDPPGREAGTYLADLKKGSLAKISQNDIEASFSPDGKLILLLTREYFGSYYPWFNRNLKFYSSRGILRNSEIYSRGLEIHPDCFSRDSTYFTFVMHNPNTFYPLPLRQRDVYIKRIASPLIIQLTCGETASQPVWL